MILTEGGAAAALVTVIVPVMPEDTQWTVHMYGNVPAVGNVWVKELRGVPLSQRPLAVQPPTVVELVVEWKPETFIH